VTILDIIDTPTPKAILNTSIETHLLDIAIPNIYESSHQGIAYELVGMSCIAGDRIGSYHFPTPLKIGDTLRIENMIGYTLVKQTRFNGIQPASFVVKA
jgi:carboxynorspermidine decarboxylase